MRVDQADDLAKANQRLAELIFENFRDYELTDLILDALPVKRESDGKAIATAIFAYPRGQSQRSVGCMYPRVTELA